MVEGLRRRTSDKFHLAQRRERAAQEIKRSAYGL
jgi:hypothetical protein